MAEDKFYNMRHSGEQIDDAVDASGKYSEQDGYVKVIVDNKKKIMFGITHEGKVNIPQMTDDTLSYIGQNSSRHLHFDKVDNGTSIKFNVGDNACIRAKFRVNESLINKKSTDNIITFGYAKIKSKVKEFTQYSKSDTYNGSSVTSYYPALNGGVTYLSDADFDSDFPLAFYVKYVGVSNNVTISNDGVKLTISVDDVETNYTLADYASVHELYVALSSREDLEVGYKEIEGHTCNELAVFASCRLVNHAYYKGSTLVPAAEWANDKAPLYIPYGVDPRWHQVEIVKIGNDIYYTCDGRKYMKDLYRVGSELVLGNANLNIEIKDVEVSLDNCLDAEIVDGLIVSSVNPSVLIFEGHGLYDKPAESFDTSLPSSYQESMGTSADRLYYVFRQIISKGYVPITIGDITSYVNGCNELPKRCFTIIFDDFRWDNCLNINNRRVFRELGVYPNLAIIHSYNDEITFDGNTISKKEASEICRNNDFGLLSHIDHKPIDSIQPSLLVDKIKTDIAECDKILVDGMVIVYPGGTYNKYTIDVLRWLGCSLGITVASGSKNYQRMNGRNVNRYALRRVEIGTRTTLDNIINDII